MEGLSQRFNSSVSEKQQLFWERIDLNLVQHSCNGQNVQTCAGIKAAGAGVSNKSTVSTLYSNKREMTQELNYL